MYAGNPDFRLLPCPPGADSTLDWAVVVDHPTTGEVLVVGLFMEYEDAFASSTLPKNVALNSRVLHWTCEEWSPS